MTASIVDDRIQAKVGAQRRGVDEPAARDVAEACPAEQQVRHVFSCELSCSRARLERQNGTGDWAGSGVPEPACVISSVWATICVLQERAASRIHPPQALPRDARQRVVRGWRRLRARRAGAIHPSARHCRHLSRRGRTRSLPRSRRSSPSATATARKLPLPPRGCAGSCLIPAATRRTRRRRTRHRSSRGRRRRRRSRRSCRPRSRSALAPL